MKMEQVKRTSSRRWVYVLYYFGLGLVGVGRAAWVTITNPVLRGETSICEGFAVRALPRGKGVTEVEYRYSVQGREYAERGEVHNAFVAEGQPISVSYSVQHPASSSLDLPRAVLSRNGALWTGVVMLIIGEVLRRLLYRKMPAWFYRRAFDNRV